MTTRPVTPDKIKAIFFDMNGTLRQRVKEGIWQREAHQRFFYLLEEAGTKIPSMDELTQRYKSYTHWADEHQVSLSETEIWTRWVLPEFPPEQIVPCAIELMFEFRNLRGKPTLKPGAGAVIAELRRRGYSLGVISNSTSTVSLPRFIEACGLEKAFDAVILSSQVGIRKPVPAIFQEAARKLKLEPALCAYIGNKPKYDVAGPRSAGFGMACIIEFEGAAHILPDGEFETPDRVFHELNDVLDVFLEADIEGPEI